jgi:hypothetical protein
LSLADLYPHRLGAGSFPLYELYGGHRSIWTAAGYPGTISLESYWIRYKRDGLARRILNLVPSLAWGGGAIVTDDQDPEAESDFDKAFSALLEKIPLWSVAMNADVLASIGHYGTIALGTTVPDGSGSNVFQQPLEGPLTLEDLLHMTPYSELTNKVSHPLNGNISDSRFGMPEFYDLKTDTAQIKLHHTRVFHLAHGLLDSRWKGIPKLESIFNDLLDLEKICASGAEGSWRTASPLRHGRIPEHASFKKEDEQDFEDQIAEVDHRQKSTILTKGGAEVELLQGRMPNFSPGAAFIIRKIAGEIGIPTRRLWGTETGERASQIDDDTLQDQVDDHRSQFCEPLLRDIISRLTELGILPETSNDVIIRWPKRKEMRPADRAIIAKQIADANAAQVRANDEPILTSTEIRKDLFDKEPIDENQT